MRDIIPCSGPLSHAVAEGMLLLMGEEWWCYAHYSVRGTGFRFKYTDSVLRCGAAVAWRAHRSVAIIYRKWQLCNIKQRVTRKDWFMPVQSLVQRNLSLTRATNGMVMWRSYMVNEWTNHSFRITFPQQCSSRHALPPAVNQKMDSNYSPR